MTVTRFRTLVTTNWLRNEISALTSGTKRPILRILDASATPDPEVDGYKEFYQVSHIPEASYFNLHALCPKSPSSLHKFPVPDANRFQDFVENLGICNDSHVVTYDRTNARFALKTWWLFRLFGHNKVSVLNGGFKKWLMDEFEVTVEEPKFERSTFHPVFTPILLRKFDDMVQNISTKSEQAIDARNPPSFSNRREELEPDEIGGHIPGSKNIPYSLLFEEDGTFKPVDELRKVFDTAGVDLQRPVVATCETALTACGLAAAAHLLGKEVVPVYNGSFKEWSQLAKPDQIEVD